MKSMVKKILSVVFLGALLTPQQSLSSPTYRTMPALWRSNQNHSRAALICVHALGLSSHAYRDFGIELSRRGFDIYAIDVRGFGINRQIEGMSKLDLDRTVGDIKNLVEAIHKEDQNKKIFLIGESMGGAVVLKAASTYPSELCGALVAAPAFKLYKMKQLTIKGLGDLIIPGSVRGPAARSVIQQATSNISLRNHWIEDNRNHKLQLSLGEALSYYRFVRNTPRYSAEIKELPVCIMHGLQDNLAQPLGSAEIFQKMPSEKKSLLIDCAAEHLILEERQLTARILDFTEHWLNEHIEQKNSVTHMKSGPITLLKTGPLKTADRAMLNKIIDLSGSRPAYSKLKRVEAYRKDDFDPLL